MDERKLVHEVWEDFSDRGESLPALIVAGSRGAHARELLSPKARLLTTILAGSHFEAMTEYYRRWGWGEYQSTEPWDHQPYPDEWLREQRENRTQPKSMFQKPGVNNEYR